MKKIFGLIIAVLFLTQISNASVIDTNRVFGVTIDGINKLSNTVTSLKNLHYKPTTRIVFDEWVAATQYVTAVNQIHPVSFIMGELLDSYYMKQYNLTQYTDRTNEYVNQFGSSVDIWEIGNEVNGEWCGTISDVVAKINAAYNIVIAKHLKTELTVYYNKGCCNKNNEMFYWINKNISASMRTGLDYVLISYYEDDCNGLQPNWKQVFDSLHTLFPNSKIGFGECGTSTASKKASYMRRYYTMNVTTPKYIGGYFWWYYRQDCTPYTKALWDTINTVMQAVPKFQANDIEDNNGILNNDNSMNKYSLENNFPNPFNPSTSINFNIPVDGFVKLKVYDMAGREVATLVNEVRVAGSYSVEFNASNLTSGVYFYKLTSGNFSATKKMLLIK